MKKKPEILTKSKRHEIELESIHKALLLAALALHDYFDFNDDMLLSFWNKTGHYADLINTPEAGIKMDYVCKLLQQAGVDVHWR